MSSTAQLLETPKQISLQSQSNQLRAALKDFERTFATDNDGRKPSKDDIKADREMAGKYREYNKIRDVLAGKLGYAALEESAKSPSKRRRHERVESGLSWTSKKQSHEATPQKSLRLNELDPYDTMHHVSPKPVLLNAIGPTPQRDGRVLGLFDMLTNSSHSSKTASSDRKRKHDAFSGMSPEKVAFAAVTQTPSRKKLDGSGDLLQHLTATPAYTPETGRRKLSKTPISEGRKFMLSQFFATPSINRFLDMNALVAKEATPLRDRVLGLSSEDKARSLQHAVDATPAYLKRSTSFKDRLLSASQSTIARSGPMSPPMSRPGPPTLRHFRSMPKLFSDDRHSFSVAEEEGYGEEDEDDHEDDLEALREMEDSQVNVLVKDSQQQPLPDLPGLKDGAEGNSEVITRIYKKKGQKRTTRRSTMRPVKGKSTDAPKFVSAGHDSSEEEDDVLPVHENNHSDTDYGMNDNEHKEQTGFDGADMDGSDFEDSHAKTVSKMKAQKTAKEAKMKKTATINPNAVAHMNFRTLKIKNKNSKAKGRGRFGRSRR